MTAPTISFSSEFCAGVSAPTASARSDRRETSAPIEDSVSRGELPTPFRSSQRCGAVPVRITPADIQIHTSTCTCAERCGDVLGGGVQGCSQVPGHGRTLQGSPAHAGGSHARLHKQLTGGVRHRDSDYGAQAAWLLLALCHSRACQQQALRNPRSILEREW